MQLAVAKCHPRAHEQTGVCHSAHGQAEPIATKPSKVNKFMPKRMSLVSITPPLLGVARSSRALFYPTISSITGSLHRQASDALRRAVAQIAPADLDIAVFGQLTAAELCSATRSSGGKVRFDEGKATDTKPAEATIHCVHCPRHPSRSNLVAGEALKSEDCADRPGNPRNVGS